MKSITCAVHDDYGHVDVVDGLPPAPTNIKEQMPMLAAMLQNLSAQLGRDQIQLQLKASLDLRRAYDADDYRSVSAVYRRGHGWIDWQENGFCIGVPKQAMQTFAQKHRGRDGKN